MVGQVVPKLEIELNQAVHGDCDGGSFKAQNPDVSKGRAERGLAITVEELSAHGHEGKDDADEAVLVDTNVYDLCECQRNSARPLPSIPWEGLITAYVEPCKPTPRDPKRSLLGSSSAFLNPGDRPDPIARRHPPEVVLLLLQCWLQVVA